MQRWQFVLKKAVPSEVAAGLTNLVRESTDNNPLANRPGGSRARFTGGQNQNIGPDGQALTAGEDERPLEHAQGRE